MPLTVVLNLQSISYPTISNNIRVDIATQLNPGAIVATETDFVSGHPARIWSFPGLPRTNYVVVMNEIDGSGNPINQLAYFDVVPDSINGDLVRDDEQLTVGSAPSPVTGTTQMFFDGGSGRPDFRGWNINPERRNQPGTMIRDVEYSWDKTTGEFNLLTPGDVFIEGEPFNIDFDPIATPAGGSVNTAQSFTTRLITTNDNILLSDFGNKLIVEPASDYLELTLPDITTATDGLPVMIEVYKSTDCCVKIISSDTINFLSGNIYIGRNESLRIYNFIRSGTGEWRVDNADGNFKTVGQIVSFDQIESGLYNCVLLDGSELDALKYSRLYDYISRLPSGQKVVFSHWNDNVNTRILFSLIGTDTFMIPDRLALYQRAANTEMAGTFWRMSLESHKHVSPYNDAQSIGAPYGRTGLFGKIGSGSTDFDNDNWFTNNGTEIVGANQLNLAGAISGETRPNSYSINQYVLV